MKKFRILVTGKSSKIGNAFSEYVREFNENENIEIKYEVDHISLRDKSILDSSWEKYDVILHVAGITKTDDGKLLQREIDEYYAVNRDLTYEIAYKAKKDGIKQFILLSTMMVYGNAVTLGNHCVIDKSVTPKPGCVYGKSKLEAEKILELSDDNFKVLVVREPVVYGESFDGEMMKLAKLAKRVHFFPKIRSTKGWIYQGNLCEFIRLGIEKSLSGIYCPQDEYIYPLYILYQRLASIQGKRCVIIPGMYPVIKIGALISKTINSVCSDISYSKDISNYNGIDYIRYSFDEAIKRMLDRIDE